MTPHARPLELGEWIEEFTDVQAQANGFPSDEARTRRILIASHVQDPGLRSVGAFDADRLVGFAFGAPFNARWSWARPMAPALGAHCHWAAHGAPFWLLEIHVVPGWWGRRIGSSLLAGLLSTVPDRWVGLTRLTTANRARQFYERKGFGDLPLVPAPRGFTVMGAPPPVQGLPSTFSNAVGTPGLQIAMMKVTEVFSAK